MKRLQWAVLAMLSLAAAFIGCTRAPANGKVQIAYTGSIRGNVSPCG